MGNKKLKSSDFRNLPLQEDKFKKGLEKINSEAKKLIFDALEIAKAAHRGQKRDEGDPYIIHPIRIANVLIYDLGIRNTDIIISALLHDVVEDTNVTLGKVEKKFGKKVSSIISFLTRDKNKETKKEKFEKTLNVSREIKLLKACDWLDNLRLFDKGRHRTFIQEAKEIYIPLAKATKNKWLIAEMNKAYERAARTQK